MPTTRNDARVRLALPKGRMQQGVFDLLAEAGIRVHVGRRAYRPTLSIADIDTKILKPQNIIEMLHVGSRDMGFAGADWVAELNADVVEVLDTQLDAVRLVAAAPAELLIESNLPDRPLILASEYTRLAEQWIASQNLDCRLLRSFGATEVFPPEDADCVIDITATGSTLAANNLVIFDELQTSSTRLYASHEAMNDAPRRLFIAQFAMLLRSVLDARRRVMLEVNVGADRLEALVEIIPCMREPTIARLHGDTGYAVKAAVPRDRLPNLIPEIKKRGGTDIVVSSLAQIIA